MHSPAVLLQPGGRLLGLGRHLGTPGVKAAPAGTQLCDGSTLPHVVVLSIRVFNTDQKLPFYCGNFLKLRSHWFIILHKFHMYNIIWKSFSIRQNSGFDLRNASNIKQLLKVLCLIGQRNCFHFQETLWLLELFIDI